MNGTDDLGAMFALERIVAGHVGPDVQLHDPAWRVAALTLAHREIATWPDDQRALVGLVLALSEREPDTVPEPEPRPGIVARIRGYVRRKW